MLVYALVFIISVAIFVIIYNFLSPINYADILEKYNNSKTENKRKRYAKQIREEQEKKSRYHGVSDSRFERKLYYSGISRKMPFITREWYIIVSGCISVITLIITYVITSNMIVSLVASISCVLALVALVRLLSDYNFKRVDKQLIKFANLIENFDRTSNGELISLLRKVAYYMDEPLKSVIIDCVEEAVLTGDDEGSLTKMRNKVESNLFKDLINNLIISSKHNSNYSEVIRAYRRVLQDHYKSGQNIRSIIVVARTNILMLVGVAAMIICMMNGMFNENVYDILSGNPLGIAAIIAIIIIAAVIVLIFLSIGRNDD